MWRMAIVWLLFSIGVVSAQTTPEKPLLLPVAAPPGPSTWLFGQPYGNTIGAYNFGQAWYRAGQGLHFGIDLRMPCGTPLVAVADGIAVGVDDLNFGSGPHNLILRHEALGLTTLYGHLLQKPALVNGQAVLQGQVVATSGDPDVTCDSRPHLHFEVRSLDYRTAYNPLTYIDANWNSFTTIGTYGWPLFEQDMDNPRRWLSLEDQPAVAFGGARLNDYQAAWPPHFDLLPPGTPPLLRILEPLPDDSFWTLRQLGTGGCCARFWWHPTDPQRLFVIDGAAGTRAGVIEWTADNGPQNFIELAPPPFESPDGSHQINRDGDTVAIRRRGDGAAWSVETLGATPAINPGNSQLLWSVTSEVTLPGEPYAQVVIWVSDIDGQNAHHIAMQAGGSGSWLDEHRVLITTPTAEDRAWTLSVYDTRDDSSYELGTWTLLRNLSVAPGSGRLMFYTAFQDDPAQNGVYTIATEPGAVAEQLPWFGGWQWRDADSLFYIPFDPTTEQQRLMYYHLTTGQHQPLTTARFTIANGEWSVSADGGRILFLNAVDRNLWLIEAAG